MLFFQLAELIKATVHTHRIYETQRASYSKGADLQVTAELKIFKNNLFKYNKFCGVFDKQ